MTMQKDLGAKKTHRNHLKMSNVCEKKRPSQVYSGDTRRDDEEEEFRVNVNATVSFLHMHVYFHF